MKKKYNKFKIINITISILILLMILFTFNMYIYSDQDFSIDNQNLNNMILNKTSNTLNFKNNGSINLDKIKKYKSYKNFKKYDSYFSGRGEKRVIKSLSKISKEIYILKQILNDNGLSEDFIYLSYIESEFNPTARSWVNAVGLWQFMKTTARIVDLKINNYTDERQDFYKSTIAFTKHMNYLLKYYNNSIELALAAYNCGVYRVDTAIRRGNTNNFWELSDKKLLPEETRLYVPKFIALVKWSKQNEKKVKAITNSTTGFVVIKANKNLNLKNILHKNKNTIYYIKNYNRHIKSNIILKGTTLLIPHKYFYNEIVSIEYLGKNISITQVRTPNLKHLEFRKLLCSNN